MSPPAEGAEIERFLCARRVAILALARDGRPPLCSPVWYEREPGRFLILVEATSAKARLLEKCESVPTTVTVQSEVPPYRHALILGRARIVPALDTAGLNARLARHYLGRVGGDLYVKEQERRGLTAALMRLVEISDENVVYKNFGADLGMAERLFLAVQRPFRPVPA